MSRYRDYKMQRRTSSGRTLHYESYLGEIDKEIHRAMNKARKKAGKHVKNKLKKACAEKFGRDSNITKGIGSKNLKKTTVVGVGPPAQAAHLVEFGTDERYHKKGKTKGKSTGYMKKDPFVYPVYQQEAETVRRILSEEWF